MLKLLLKSPMNLQVHQWKPDQAQNKNNHKHRLLKVKDQLPATGGEESATLALLGGLGLVLSAVFVKKGKRIKNSKKSYSMILDKH